MKGASNGVIDIVRSLKPYPGGNTVLRAQRSSRRRVGARQRDRTKGKGLSYFLLPPSLRDCMSSNRLVLLNYSIAPQRWAKLEPHLLETFVPAGYRVIRELTDGDAALVRVLVNKTRELTDAHVQKFPELRAILVWGTQPWMLSLDGAARTGGAGPLVRTLAVDRGTAVAELAISLMLLGLKRLSTLRGLQWLSARRLYRQLFPVVASETRGAHNWANRQTGTVYQKRVGIVGYGLIGRQIHRRLVGFDCDVAYYHHKPFSSALEHRLGLVHLGLAQLFAACDVVFLQLPLTDQTRGFVTADVLARAKPDLVLVNCGRAAVVEKDALYAALREGRIRFYAADVFWQEPMPLWDQYRWLPNAFITPHMAESVSGSPDVQKIMIRELKQLIEDIDD